MIADARFELGCEARARGVRLLFLEEVDSTNDEAKRLILAGERGPLWVVARRQTRGKGRLGRAWISPPGNLHASLILSGDFAPSVAPRLGFVAGIALIEAVRQASCLGASGLGVSGLGASGLGDRLALKWPNDLLLDGGKLAGVLLEGVPMAAAGAHAAPQCVVVGVGVNCAEAPEGLPYPARALGAGGSAPAVFTALADAFVAALDLWAEGRGFEAIRTKWLAAAGGLKAPIRVALSTGEEVRGRFETIDAGGRLVVATADGERIIDAGDVLLAHDEPNILEQPDSHS